MLVELRNAAARRKLTALDRNSEFSLERVCISQGVRNKRGGTEMPRSPFKYLH
jgi:hypothetical protein